VERAALETTLATLSERVMESDQQVPSEFHMFCSELHKRLLGLRHPPAPFPFPQTRSHAAVRTGITAPLEVASKTPRWQ